MSTKRMKTAREAALAQSPDVKAAESRGYARGYAAGKKRRERDNNRQRAEAKRAAFIERAFLAVLPAAMSVSGWRFGDKQITTTEDRVELARRWATEALKKRDYL